MKPEIETRCLRHAQALAELFPNATKTGLALCRALRRLEREASNIAVAYCNGELPETEWEPKRDKIRARLVALLGESPATPYLYLNGDPRGYALKLDDTFTRQHNATAQTPITTDWGQFGILAPDLSN